jgi:hypothetical protein
MPPLTSIVTKAEIFAMLGNESLRVAGIGQHELPVRKLESFELLCVRLPEILERQLAGMRLPIVEARESGPTIV